MAGKRKVNFKQLYDDKDNFKYKSSFPKSTVNKILLLSQIF